MPVGKTKVVSLDQALSNIDVGYFHIRLLVACGLGFAAAAVELVLAGILIVSLRQAWDLSEYTLGLLPIIVQFGLTCGEVFWGHVADRFGRRVAFMATVFITSIFSLGSAMSPNVWYLFPLRFLVGFGNGGSIAVDFPLYAEFMPTHCRGRMLFYLATFWPVGQFCASILAWCIIPQLGWRAFLAACAVPSILVAFLRPLIPESPRWLLVHGFQDDAKRVLREMATLNGQLPEDVGLPEDIELSLDSETTELLQSSGEHGFLASCFTLFGPELWRTTAGLIVFNVGLGAMGYGVTTLMPTLLAAKGIVDNALYETLVISTLCQLIGNAVAGVVATVFGRVRSVQLSLLPVGISMCFFAYANSQLSAQTWSCLASGCLNLGWALFHVYVPEAFPTNLRATAIGLVSASGSLTIVTPLICASLLESNRVDAATLVFSLIAIMVSIALFFLLHVETKDRDLKDIITLRARAS